MTDDNLNPKRGDYRVIAISMYEQDLAELASKVAKLRQRGLRWMSKSALIRIALRRLDLDAIAGEERR